MFTIKHAIMEILNKSKSLDEVLAVLDTEDQATLLATFDLMKAKLGGSMDVMDTQDNGQWSLAKNTLDYSKINPPKPKRDESSAPTLNYNSPELKTVKEKPKPWTGAVKRRDEVRAKIQREADAAAREKIPDSKSTKDKSAMESIKERREGTAKSEDKLQQIKNKYGDKKPKSLDEEVADVKERFTPKPPKTDEQKAEEAKEKYRQESKLKAEQPFKSSMKTPRRR